MFSSKVLFFYQMFLGFYFHKNLDRYPTPKELMKKFFCLIFVKN
ncbi:hypothetical protein HMPREF1400_01497 [Helicobacter pylori GAM119Bi]|nr:hypothetical protein HMPREF1400_01497 [Helicobacter pylori GAM119Bi]